MIEISLVHWTYLLTVLAIVFAMVLRRGVVLIATAGIFLIGFVFHGSAIGATQTVFKALEVAGQDLFDIMLVIAMMVAMLKVMESMGADYLMVAPIKKFMAHPVLSFFLLGIIMYICALFFWPTPATALVGVILIPVAVRSGLPPMAAAMSVNILGHGMALSGDLFLQGAPGITAGAAGISIDGVLRSGGILSVITGLVAILVAFLMMRKEIAQGVTKEQLSAFSESEPPSVYTRGARFMAGAVPLVFVGLVILMGFWGIRGGDSTALLGGTAALFLILGSLLSHGNKALEKMADYIKEGFLFSIKIFAAVIPIAGFFFLGSPEPSAMILGGGAPGLLFDLGTYFSSIIPVSKIPVTIGMMVIGMITGLDGSGFSGLPLVGSLAQALGGPLGVDVAVLAASGQIASIFTGGGTLSAWAFGLVATAGVAGVAPMDLARKNFIPVLCGLAAACIVAIVMM